MHAYFFYSYAGSPGSILGIGTGSLLRGLPSRKKIINMRAYSKFMNESTDATFISRCVTERSKSSQTSQYLLYSIFF